MRSVVILVLTLGVTAVQAQHQHGTASKPASDEEKIRSAMSAAPAEIAKNATIMDWPASPGAAPRQLKAGNNGWVCYPSSPAQSTHANDEDPMCLDAQWQKWAEAWMAKKTPQLSGPGIAYMLKGDKGASNTDPFATGPTAENHWVTSGPHVMVLVADPKLLDSYPVDPTTGGPWVMFKGTPFAHIMVPVGGAAARLHKPGTR